MIFIAAKPAATELEHFYRHHSQSELSRGCMKHIYRRRSSRVFRDEFQQHQLAGVGLDGANRVQPGAGHVDTKVLSAAQTGKENAHAASGNTSGYVVISDAEQSGQL
uniref:(northern house mosquito) hypothetical protein n=1 Tax=Culex pipiens TaxID=7175 RepID=A0A8D8FS05_CULPI